MELIYGDFQPMLIDNNVYAYARTYFDDVIIVAFK